jgi:hypothetical protein
MTMGTEMNRGEDWTASGRQKWALQTADGYVGKAHWGEQGAGITVIRPDGTDLFSKTWGSRQIFLASWPGMFDWLKRQVTQQIAAERVKASESPPSVSAADSTVAAPMTNALP